MTRPIFTEGPWVFEAQPDDDSLGWVGIITAKNLHEVTSRRSISEEDEANFALMAAAPELYDVVSSLFELPDDADGGYICDMWERMQGKAEEALKKARGEQ
ncbi:hypothetical protein R84981_003012 [Carnimonas sp. R-84981]|uniref:hypothetical protein n=1 Tax=Carnimonas bestiolae TaxID=3402172 RepID=UPI003EDBFF00